VVREAYHDRGVVTKCKSLVDESHILEPANSRVVSICIVDTETLCSGAERLSMPASAESIWAKNTIN
jgi:hypothetical protein